MRNRQPRHVDRTPVGATSPPSPSTAPAAASATRFDWLIALFAGLVVAGGSLPAPPPAGAGRD
jgi:hypothetical protein